MPATQVEVLLRMNGKAAEGSTQANGKDAADKKGGGKGEGGGTDKATPDTPILKKMLGGVGKFVKGTLGLNFGISALVKQSQIFTSTVGVIFQLLGALVDVMLAPLIPLFLPLIRMLSAAIPLIQRNIVPIIENIVSWLLGFFGKWDGTWDMLWGEEGLGGLWTKFQSWWDAEAMPWLKEKAKEVQEWIGNKIVEMWEWFKETGTRVQGWIITLIITQTGRLLGWLIRLPIFLFKLLLKIPGFLIRMAGLLIKMMFPIIGNLFTWLVEKVWGIVKWLKDKVLKLAGTIISGIFKGGLDLIKMIMKGLGVALGKIPFIGGALKKMTEKVVNLAESAKNPKALAKSIGSKLLPLAKMSKAIPVLGAVATIGFGAIETVKAFQDKGFTAGVLTLTKTVAAAGLTMAGFSAAGLATDIAGSVVIGMAFKDKKAQEAQNVGQMNGNGGLAYGGGPSHPGNQINVQLTTNIVDPEGQPMSQEIADLKASIAEDLKFEQDVGNSGHPFFR